MKSLSALADGEEREDFFWRGGEKSEHIKKDESERRRQEIAFADCRCENKNLSLKYSILSSSSRAQALADDAAFTFTLKLLPGRLRGLRTRQEVAKVAKKNKLDEIFCRRWRKNPKQKEEKSKRASSSESSP